ncbi:MAG: isoprenyl transferase [Ruminococcaceae bacterium]|nr:isoprenyl transferase [Oscillospiraceae bacterium]
MRFWRKKTAYEPAAEQLSPPEHIAIIMDGNGRWAKKRGLPRTAGHKAGAKTLEHITRAAGRMGVRYLTVYAFSTENWKRPAEEVSELMKLLGTYLDDYRNLIGEDDIRIRVIGSREGLSVDILEKIDRVEQATADRKSLTLNIALNYGGREEITAAVRRIATEVAGGRLECAQIDQTMVGAHLYTADIPDPDLVIRPSGEQRLSNFLLWQCAYSEFWYSDVNWPDFTEQDLRRAIDDYHKRNRRFGGV